MKKLVSILTAVIVASSLCTTAFAADYATNPNYGVPTAEVAAPGSDVGKSAEKPAALVTPDFLKEIAKADAPVVHIKDDKAVVKADAITALQAAGKTITFQASSYSLTIDPASITAIAAELDLSFGIKATTEATKVGDVAVPANAIVIAPASKGDFHLSVTLTIPKAALGTVDTAKAKLFYIADDGSVKDMGGVKVNADGSVSVTISHASQYVIAESLAVSADDTSKEVTSNPKTGSSTAVVWQIVTVVALFGAFGVSRKLARSK